MCDAGELGQNVCRSRLRRPKALHVHCSPLGNFSASQPASQPHTPASQLARKKINRQTKNSLPTESARWTRLSLAAFYFGPQRSEHLCEFSSPKMRKSAGGFHSTSNEDGQHGDGSSVRLLRIPRAAPAMENYGFQLTRSKWDPYPWVIKVAIVWRSRPLLITIYPLHRQVCEVAAGTPAALCGLKPGDCVLEVSRS